jgi:thymidylate synthase (FAD)
MNRQGRGDVLEGAEAARVLDLLREDATRNYDHYLEMLNEDDEGAARDESRQGRGDVLEGAEAARVLDLLREDATRNYDHYLEMLNENDEGAARDEGRQGLARELARMNLTLNAYTQWYWKTDLHNLLHFLSLRADAHAQYEIRVYAEAMLKTVEAWVPMAFEAFRDYRMGAVTLSAQMIAILRRMLAGEAVTQETSGLSKREWREMMDMLGR